eukprot:COSAG02_NODE_48843_length_331_cov_0.663793_1_plen_41_part_10
MKTSLHATPRLLERNVRLPPTGSAHDGVTNFSLGPVRDSDS